MTTQSENKKRSRKRLGEMLVEAGIIDEIQLTVALGAQNDSGLRLGKQLLKLGFVDEGDLALFLKDDTDISIPLIKRTISKEAFAAIPEAIAFKYKVIPIALVGKTIVLATSTPKDLKLMDELSFLIDKKIHPVRTFEWDIESALLKFYKNFSDDELAKLTNISSSSADQYSQATWALDGEILLDEKGSKVYKDNSPASMAKKSPTGQRGARVAPSQTAQRPQSRQTTRGQAPPMQTPHHGPATQQPATQESTQGAEEFIIERTSQTESPSQVTPSARVPSRKDISDAAIRLKNADILQAIIDLLVDKQIITQKELLDRLIALQKNLDD